MKTKNPSIMITIMIVVFSLSVNGQDTLSLKQKDFLHHVSNALRGVPHHMTSARHVSQRGRSHDMVSQGLVINFTGKKIIRSLSRTIENPTDSAIEFRFADLPQTDSQYLADYILSAVTNPLDTEQAKVEILWATAHDIKPRGKRVMNTSLIFTGSSGDSLLFAKEHSITGRTYSTPISQCGNSSDQGRVTNLATGYFVQDDFSSWGMPNHAGDETKILDRPVLTDYDAGTGVFMVRNPNTPSGWASLEDVTNDTSLITEKFLCSDSSDPLPGYTLERYRETMAGRPVINCHCTPPVRETMKIDGRFILSPHSKIIDSLHQLIFLLDTSLIESKLFMARVNILADSVEHSNCMPCYDSIREMIKFEWNTSDIIVNELFVSGNLVAYDGVLNQGQFLSRNMFESFPEEKNPSILLETNSLDTVHIGPELKAPLFIMEAGNGIFGDTVGPYVAPIWNDTGSVTFTYKNLNYLESGMLPPGHNFLKLSFNKNELSLFDEWNISGGSGLILSNSVEFLDNTTTKIPSIHSDEKQFMFSFVSDKQLVVSDACAIVDMTGRTIGGLTKGNNDISFLSQGVYLLVPPPGEKGYKVVVR